MAVSSHFEISRQTHAPGHAMHISHSHAWYEMFYLTRGKCDILIDDNIYALDEGSIVILSPEISHKTSYSEDRRHERLCIEFSERFVQPLFEQFKGRSFSDRSFFIIYVPEEYRRLIGSVIDNMTAEKQNSDEFSLPLINNYLQELILQLMRNGKLLHGDNVRPSVPADPMRQAAEYISLHFTEDLTLSKVASLFHLNPCYFSKKFKSFTGIGFKEYLLNIRITYSERLLLETQKSITEIAFECGFDNGNYYGDAFRRQNRVSPSTFRKLKGNI